MEDIKPEQKTEKSSLWDIFKLITGILFILLLVYKLALSNLVFDFTKFDFNALLALILSLFAIALSVAFYFKATDTSNLFYDNTYKFTKEISEILGRIEAGFGERLRHLDEGYSGLVNKFDNGFNEANINETKEDIKIEMQKLKQETEERNSIINTLIEKAHLEKGEKEMILQQLKDKEHEILKQNREINFLRSKLKVENENKEILDEIPYKIYAFLVKYIKENDINIEDFIKYSMSILNRKFQIRIKDLSKDELVMLLSYRIINDDGSFTTNGLRTFRKVAIKLSKNKIN